MRDNLLHLSVTNCIQCGDQIKGDPDRTICNDCVCAAIEEAHCRVPIKEEIKLTEVIDINRKEKEQEKKIIQKMVKEAEALDW